MHSTECPRLATVAASFSAEFAKNILSCSAFPESQLHHQGDPLKNCFLRCAKCHTCLECKEKKDIHAFDGLSSECRTCQKQRVRWTCDACKHELQEHDFDANIFENAGKHNRNRVCTSCCNKGMSPKDVSKYRCDECGDHGHLKFPYETRRKYTESGGRTKIVCSDCMKRHAQLENLLRQPSSWKCKCPTTSSGKSHNPENVRCDLFESQMGQRRWPGKNMKVSEDDWHFVERMRKRRKT